MRIFGFRVRRFGTPLRGGALFVANHVSWMDIELMHAERVVGFVAKSEISRWPLIGWLARRAGTIYHRRGSNESLAGVLHMRRTTDCAAPPFASTACRSPAPRT
jgi:1-acyl-sn-glycerol-3-phosphate acyltransferase